MEYEDVYKEKKFGPPMEGIPAVSVLLIVYNHEPYIREAIESVFSQQIDFSVQLIIAEDFSTDATRSIISEVCNNSPIPGVIIEDTRNRGLLVNYRRGILSCDGTYVALLEGDDKWIDNKKLMRQFNVLEENKSVDLTFHPSEVYVVDKDNVELHSFHSSKPQFFRLRDVICGDGGYMQTSSIFVRRSCLMKMPAWIYFSEVLDYYIQIYSAQRGGAIYLPFVMSYYRSGVSGSWTERMRNPDEYVRQMYSIALHLRLIEQDMPRTDRRFVRRMRIRYLNSLIETGLIPEVLRGMINYEIEGCRERSGDVVYGYIDRVNGWLDRFGLKKKKKIAPHNW